MRHGCRMLGIIAGLVAAMGVVDGAPDWEEMGFRYQISKDWERNKALLSADVVDLEMRVGETRQAGPVLFKERNTGERETLGQLLGATYRMEFAEGLVLTHRMDLAMALMEYQGMAEEPGSNYDRWTQAHYTNLRWEVSPSLTLEGFNEMRQQYRGDLDQWEQVEKYGLGVGWRGLWKTDWNLRAWSEVRQDWLGRVTETEALQVSMDYAVRPGTGVRPELLLEERTDWLGNVGERTTASLGLNQRIYKSYVSMNLKPGVTWEEYPEAPQQDRQYRNLDGSVRWTPLPGLAVVTGVQLRQRVDMAAGPAEWKRDVYWQMDQRAGEDFQMRLRGDYQVTERRSEDYWEEASNKMRVSVGPQWQVTETLKAGAEYRYLNDYRGPYADPVPVEQVVALSLSSEF